MPIDKRLLLQAQAIREEIDRRRAQKALHDPVSFARSCGFTPAPWQEKLLRCDSKRIVLLTARQAGKSTVCAYLALHRALTVFGALVLVISPSQRQSAELLLKIKKVLGEMPQACELTEDNKLSITLASGSRIVSLPANEGTIRGFSAVNLLIEDEAGDVPDELYIAVRPMLAVSGGQNILMGTPKGRRGHFFETWENGGDDRWTKIRVTADDITHYAPGELEEAREDLYRRGLGDYFKQEYYCEFVNAAAGRVYSGFDAKRNLVDELPPANEWTYLCGLDFGIQDQNAVTVLGWRAHDNNVYVIESYRITAIPSEMAEEVKRLDAKYHFARIVGDVGGMGKAFAEEARRRFYLPIEPADKHNKLGYIALLNGDLHTGRLKLLAHATRDLQNEWISLPWDEGGKKEAEGFDNHAADSCLYAWRATTAFLETTRNEMRPGTAEWQRKEQEDLLARDLEKHERQRGGEWWEEGIQRWGVN